MGLGGSTASAHVSLSQRGADSAGLLHTDTENAAAIRAGESHGTSEDYNNCPSIHNHHIRFFSFIHKKMSSED